MLQKSEIQYQNKDLQLYKMASEVCLYGAENLKVSFDTRLVEK